ncbi:MAG: hypothetical protein ACRDPT_06010, partial [Streptomycetales bacterium]
MAREREDAIASTGRDAPDTPDAPDAPADRLVGPGADGDEHVIEGALRPHTLAEFVGQRRVREQLSLVLEAARRR